MGGDGGRNGRRLRHADGRAGLRQSEGVRRRRRRGSYSASSSDYCSSHDPTANTPSQQSRKVIQRRQIQPIEKDQDAQAMIGDKGLAFGTRNRSTAAGMVVI